MAHSGRCMCGAISFTIDADVSTGDACHCTSCRKQSGHYWASFDVARNALTIKGEDHIKWYQSSEKVRRGFCNTCGSTLFWDPVFRDWTSVAMGALDQPTQMKLSMHIYVSKKGDYYDIGDGLPQNQT
ncbi:GFA family protein [Yoonia maritima]|uniref:GFA family protein n=1 Tax=Yoonia maritima TaxID=1435347 RepID=UPI000D0EDD87|nr:GFA family protein [Yoonia maritima]